MVLGVKVEGLRFRGLGFRVRPGKIEGCFKSDTPSYITGQNGLVYAT